MDLKNASSFVHRTRLREQQRLDDDCTWRVERSCGYGTSRGGGGGIEGSAQQGGYLIDGIISLATTCDIAHHVAEQSLAGNGRRLLCHQGFQGLTPQTLIPVAEQLPVSCACATKAAVVVYFVASAATLFRLICLIWR